MEETPLTIYHASAGTGKTFTLVKNYLALVLENTNDFRNILAVTFAVKAATEMKERILRVLYGLTKAGLPEYEDTQEVIEAVTYLQQLPEAWRREPEQIRKKARSALRLILYEYPAFSVQTIDSFFQRVLRSFARELNLPFAFEMEFDQKEVLKEIIDLLLIQAGDDPVLLSWLIKMMEELGDDSGNWDVRKLLMQEGEEIFTETFKSLRRETLDLLTDRDLLRDYLDLLSGIITSFEKTLERLGHKGLEVFQHHGVEENDFSGKNKGVAGIFRKMIKGRDLFNGESPFKKMFMAALEDPEKWLRAEQRSDVRLLSLVKDHLQPLIREIYDYYRQNARNYFTARVLRKRLYTLGIMADLRRQLFVWMQEKNRFLISETGTFLHEIMGENEIPFIYEKTGQHFLYYMIDEFQDTSRVQYEDLLPLLHNSLALGGPSLIVGDIKQSLYRWRNGDWEIMHRDVYRDLGLGDAVKKRLQVNYRSREEIVRFNNAFFTNAGKMLWKMYREDVGDVLPDDDVMLRHQQEVLLSIYDEDEVRQEVPEGVTGGYVAVRLVAGERKDAWHQEALEQSAQLIDDLIGRGGWSPGAVMLLVRSNKDGREVVRYLLERQHRQPDAVQYPVVSKESLYLSASPAIRFLIAFLRYLNDPADTLNFAELWHLQERLHHGEYDAVPPLHKKILEDIPPAERIFLFLDPHDQPWLSRLSGLPLPEVVQAVTNHFRLQERREDVPFLHTFQNFLTEFVNREGSDAVAFL
jgi:ATP-dependent exoDNAse (exonuclease V) beta subunit